MADHQLASEQCLGLWNQLQQRWQETQSQWQDSVAARFEREFWSEWAQQTPPAIQSIQRLEEAIAAAERELNEAQS